MFLSGSSSVELALFLFFCFWPTYSVSQAEEASYSLTLSRPQPFVQPATTSGLPRGDVQCVARPPGCALSCSGGYEGTLGTDGRVLCQCQCRPPIQTATCQTYGLLFCRPDERCTSQNGQVGCASPIASNVGAGSGTVFVSPTLQQMPHAALPVNVVPLRPFLPIRPLQKPPPADENEAKYLGAGKSETNFPRGEEWTTGGGGWDGGDPCEGVTCDESPFHECQLVESDCGDKTTQKPKICPPVAKCLINPCPRGTPLRLPNSGVTALCRRDGQCLDGWCHKIGYNGLGFCCPLPVPSQIKDGRCEGKQTTKRMMAWEPRANCSAECRAEERKQSREEGEGAITQNTVKKPSAECPLIREERIQQLFYTIPHFSYIFDGCSLRCTRRTSSIPSNASLSLHNELHKKAEKIAEGSPVSGECPQWPSAFWTQFCPEGQRENGHDECEGEDGHCPSGLKCCVGPCNHRFCLYPSLEGNSECVAQSVAFRIVAELNSDNKSIFEPKCDAKGQFAAEQTDGDFTFCVDERGKELAGSRRRSDQFIGCDQKQNCPSAQCHLKCPFGFQFGSEGCPQCKCRDSPCHAVKCPKEMVCKMNPYNCRISPAKGQHPSTSKSNCAVPECLPNVCMKGEPLEDALSGQLVQCNERDGIKCPPGWHCHQIGIGPMGFCCSGMLLQSELLPSSNQCPTVPNLSYKLLKRRQSERILGCRLSRECPSRQICCFDGASTRCLALSEKGEVERSPVGGHQSELSPKKVRHLGECPFRLLNASNPGCASNCASDADCARRSPFLRCCPVGCGTQCQFGDKLTPCVHLLATTLREVDKLVEVPKSIGRPTVQCNGEGHFEKAQFDPMNGQFWCVDPVTGVEAVGSRISASPLGPVNPPPDDCSLRHFCKSNCSALKGLCPHGLRMDHRGCPLDEQCQCRNACDDFKCSFPDKEICLLKVVECVDEAICPPIPTCVQNVCQRFGVQSIGNFVCSNSAECQKKDGNPDRVVECKFGPSNFTLDRIGICCASPLGRLFKEQSLSALSADLSSSMSAGVDAFTGKTLSKVEGVSGSGGRRQGLCPAIDAGGVGEGDCSHVCSTDADCAGIQKCCPKTARGCRQCVQPLLTTNCQNLLSAVLSLDAARIQHFVSKPNCNSKTGAFSRVQCDGQGWCWCVESTSTGFPLSGTRLFQPMDGEMFCERPKPCPLEQCPANLCPFGVEVDLDGCPLSSECRCRSPCDQIKCPNGQICLLWSRNCLEAEQTPAEVFGRTVGICLPVPICEQSPCGGILKPLLNLALLVPQKCQLDADNGPISLPQCPAAFQCIRQRENYSVSTAPEGICCPGEKFVGDGAVESEDREQQISATARDKGANFCYLPVHQGSGVEECGMGRSEMRYFYDLKTDGCEAFLFAGCGGNGNNFKSESECEKKCQVVANRRGNGAEGFEVGFVLDEIGHSRRMESSLRDYLRKAFALTEGQIQKVRMDEPTKGQVHFTIVASDARQKAKRISETLALGQFQFPHDGIVLRARSNGWWTKRTTDGGEGEGDEHGTDAEKMEMGQHFPLFWVLLVSVVIFALVVLFIPCCAFVSVLSSPRVRALGQHNWSPMTNARNDGISTTPTVLMEESEDRVRALRTRSSAVGGGMPSQPPREDHLPMPLAVAPSSPSPAASSTASTHLAHRQRIIAPRILTEEGGETERIRRGERTSVRSTWRWRT
uniref:Uncharacterized protein n=1 Tax=Globodera rostochiensis TaxID=31243 RepID=A0A914H2W1_GLORO